MAKRMLVDASHPEETRVVVLNGTRLEELDFESAAKAQLKGNIYLAKVTRVEPSLQAAFVEYGGNRHGFLAFSEIHPDYYRIPVADRESLMADAARQSSRDLDVDGSVDEVDSGPSHGGRGQRPAALDRDADDDEAPPAAGGQGEPPPPGIDEGDEPSGPDDAAGASQDDDGAAFAEGAETAGDGDGAEAAGDPRDAEPQEQGDPAGDDDDGAHATADADAGSGGGVETVGGDDVEEEASSRPRYPRRTYKIQEVIKRRQIMLVQVTKEERGNKGAALTTYLSLAGRYCVLMPNTPRGGGISRKISNPKERKRMKAILDALEVPEGMAVILRTAGLERTKAEIKRDLDYLLRLWDSIRELTLTSTAPTLIHEEANLIKRAERDLYSKDIDEILVAGEDSYRVAKDFMRMLMPSHAKKVKLYKDETIPLFHRFQVESQIDAMHSPSVQLRSGGYIVINPTEALVAIDVNSGRSTRERNIEETAYRTNVEAAEEIARQLRLRDLAGLIVIDFIDMEDDRHIAIVERKLKEALRTDRARIQVGRISPFGLMEMSRQRLRPSLAETHFEVCPSCAGTGQLRSIGSSTLRLLRSIEEEGLRRRAAELTVRVPTDVALYVLNQKREALADIESRYDIRVYIDRDDSLIRPDFHLERRTPRAPGEEPPPVIDFAKLMAETDDALAAEAAEEAAADEGAPAAETRARPKRARRSRRRDTQEPPAEAEAPAPPVEEDEAPAPAAEAADGSDDDKPKKRRRRGKRGGRRRNGQRVDGVDGGADDLADGEDAAADTEEAEGDGTDDEAFTAQESDEDAPWSEQPAAGPDAWDRSAPDAADTAATEAEEPAPADSPTVEAEEPSPPEAIAAAQDDVWAELPPEEPQDSPPAAEPATEEQPTASVEEPAADEPVPEEAATDDRHEDDQAGGDDDDGRDAHPGHMVNVPPDRPRRGWWQRLLD
ncbi:MAG: Rne/Rng family ribonuclease [Rhodospirillaceae bacterium]|nr:Rne/Rng family ribonuclease [Rhodospirillaceae bacterium]